MQQLATRATGWRLDRRDGHRIGFTSHDRAVRIDGLDYLPQPGLSVTSIRKSGTYEPGGLDTEGAIDSAHINEDDLLAGRWRQARILAFTYDWERPEEGIEWLVEAEIARIAVEKGRFRAELVELRPTATAYIVPRTSPGCRAVFAGPECGLSPARYRHAAVATDIDGSWLTLDALPAGADFAHGMLRWLGGPNRGLRHGVLAQEDNRLRLDLPPYFAADMPLAVELLEGCDHGFSTCRSRFANAVNFRGEPYLPGMDFLIRYPS